MSTKHVAWVAGILAAFVAWLGMELWAVLDGAAWTEPFTDITVHAIPAGVGIPAVIGFAIWIVLHFVSRWMGHPVLVRRLQSNASVVYTQTDMDEANERYFNSGWDAAHRETSK